MKAGSWIVSQLGARMHYAVPRILHEAGILQGFFTDIHATQGALSLLNLVPRPVRSPGLERFLARRPDGIPRELVHSFPLLGLAYKRRAAAARTTEDAVKAYIWMGREFGKQVLESSGQSWAGAYVFNSAGLEVLEFCRREGRRGVVEQCSAPHLKELRLLREEALANPEWGQPPDITGADAEYAEVEQKEWAAADRVICPSEWVKTGLIEAGADPAKICLVPYGVDVERQNAEILKAEMLTAEDGHTSSGLRSPSPQSGEGEESRKRKAEMDTTSSDLRSPSPQGGEGNESGMRRAEMGATSSGLRPPSPRSGEGIKAEREKNRPLRVLVAGRVCLQKGSQRVLEAADILRDRVQIRMAGSFAGVPESILQKLRQRLELLGPVPRSRMAEQYQWADVFLLPSLCEGSATVTYEALAHGLPVICTPNTGSVVRDGVEGFIVPARDATAIAARIERLAQDGELRAQMAQKARARAAEFTVAEYGRRLLSALAA